MIRSALLALTLLAGLACTQTAPQQPVAQAPVFDVQPTDVTMYTNANASFSAHAVGTPEPTYQWMKSQDQQNWEYVDCKTQTLTVETDLSMDGSWFRCDASNSAGKVESNTAKLTVLP